MGDPFGLENQDQNSNVIPIGGGIVGDPFGLENQGQKAKGEQKRQECK